MSVSTARRDRRPLPLSTRARLAAAIERLEQRIVFSTFTVTTLADSGAGSLRQAIADAELAIDADEIVFDSSLTGTVGLTSVGDTAYGQSALLVTTDITITGSPNPDNSITIARTSGSFRLFAVASTGSLTINNVTLADGIAKGGNGGNGRTGGGGGAGLGGAIFNAGALTISRATFQGNTAQGGNGGTSIGGTRGGGGGGIGSNGVAGSSSNPAGGGPNGGTGSNSTSTPGAAGGFGGGGGGGYATSTGGRGGAGGFGGGSGGVGAAYSSAGGVGGFGGGGGGALTSPLAGYGGGNGTNNAGGGGAGFGGAVFNYGGTVTLTNATFTSNSAFGGAGAGFAAAGTGRGGAIFNYNGTVSLNNNTIYSNTASGGGTGVFAIGNAANVTTHVDNSILANVDTTVTDFEAATLNGGASASDGLGNLIRTNTFFDGTVVSIDDPNLAALGSNFGPTQTFLPNTGSPVINAGDSPTATGLATDQRFQPRRSGTAVDIGAVEVQLAPVITSADTATFTNGVAGTFTVTTISSPTASLFIPGQTLPLGLTFTDNSDGTGTISGTPNGSAGGLYGTTIYANNGVDAAVPQSFTVILQQTPSISVDSEIHMTVNEAQNVAVNAGGYPAVTLSTTGTLPTGIIFIDNGSGHGTFTGTALEAAKGTYNITVHATNGVSPDASTPVTLIVQDPPLVVEENTLPEVSNNRTIGLTFAYPLSAAPPVSAFSLFERDSQQDPATSNRRKLRVRGVTYDAGTQSIAIQPKAKLKSNRFYVLKADSSQITDANGNSLDGANNGTPGSAFELRFGRGNVLTYIDSEGNKIRLRLRGPGLMVLTRNAAGDALSLNIVGATAKTRLVGWVRPTELGGDGTTTLPSITGLGAGVNELETDQFIF